MGCVLVQFVPGLQKPKKIRDMSYEGGDGKDALGSDGVNHQRCTRTLNCHSRDAESADQLGPVRVQELRCVLDESEGRGA